MDAKYLLFIYLEYDPEGGWDDFHGLFPSEQAAKKAIEAIIAKRVSKLHGQIVDLDKLEVVRHFYSFNGAITGGDLHEIDDDE